MADYHDARRELGELSAADDDGDNLVTFHEAAAAVVVAVLVIVGFAVLRATRA
ncbi:hypothetical protein QBC44DRAFT_371270 [Cladorrhinum sp. PSN332]|nr:hypothetical protein QBC44DRAFT_371270 [Cladorrhinum sp. PSN332]